MKFKFPPIDQSKVNGAQFETLVNLQGIVRAEYVLFQALANALMELDVSGPGMEKKNAYTFFTETHDIDRLRVGNYLRLGGELEVFFGHYYALKKNVPWRSQQIRSMGPVFQRVLPSPKYPVPGLVDLYLKDLGMDLRTVPKFKSIQEYFVHRHLYTHQTGLLDRKYLDDLERVVGKGERDSIETDALRTGKGAAIEDVTVYSFKPISERFSTLLNDAIKFVTALPQ